MAVAAEGARTGGGACGAETGVGEGASARESGRGAMLLALPMLMLLTPLCVPLASRLRAPPEAAPPSGWSVPVSLSTPCNPVATIRVASMPEEGGTG